MVRPASLGCAPCAPMRPQDRRLLPFLVFVFSIAPSRGLRPLAYIQYMGGARGFQVGRSPHILIIHRRNRNAKHQGCVIDGSAEVGGVIARGSDFGNSGGLLGFGRNDAYRNSATPDVRFGDGDLIGKTKCFISPDPRPEC